MQNFNNNHFNNSWLILGLLLSTLLLILVASPLSAQNKEYQVKAAFIIKLARFVSWPDAIEAENQNSKLNLCFSKAAKKQNSVKQLLLEDGSLQSHFNILPLDVVESCHILFIVKSNTQELIELLNSSEQHKTGILTFSDTPGYAQRGVMINFYEDNHKIRFEINWNAMKANGFEISSRVLKLARIVNE